MSTAEVSDMIIHIDEKTNPVITWKDTLNATLLVFGYIRLNTQMQFSPSSVKSLCGDFYGYYFDGSNILKKMEQRFNLFTLLSSKLTSKSISESQLLLRGSRDGYEADTFLEKLKNKAPYLFLIETNYGNICGGYSNIECTSRIKKDTSSFVFVLESDLKEQTAEIFPLKPSKYDYDHVIDYCNQETSPDSLFYFGPSCPLSVVVNGNENWDNCCMWSSIYSRSGSDDFLEPHVICGGPENDGSEGCAFKVTEMEIFNISLQ